MQLTITIDPRNVLELRSAIGTLNHLLVSSGGQSLGETYEGVEHLLGNNAGKPATEKKEPKPRAPKPAAQEPAAPAPAAGEASTGAEAAATADAPAVTLDDVTAATLALGKAGKRDDIQRLLAKYGAARASLIAQEKWAAYVADAKAVLG